MEEPEYNGEFGMEQGDEGQKEKEGRLFYEEKEEESRVGNKEELVVEKERLADVNKRGVDDENKRDGCRRIF